jgi:hypothetical protein
MMWCDGVQAAENVSMRGKIYNRIVQAISEHTGDVDAT